MSKWLNAVAVLAAFLNEFAAFVQRLERQYGASDPDAQEASSLLSRARLAHEACHAASSSEAPAPVAPIPQPPPEPSDAIEYPREGDSESFRF